MRLGRTSGALGRTGAPDEVAGLAVRARVVRTVRDSVTFDRAVIVERFAVPTPDLPLIGASDNGQGFEGWNRVEIGHDF